uniref:ArgE/DapE family deacylase n=1 Tax=uncultured Limosilactobacillus sp. TaxID=2837629 RepID=UPI0025FFD903
MDKEKQLAIFKHIINTKTVNNNEAALADYLAGLFEPYADQGVKVEKVNYAPGRDNVVVTIGHGEKVLGFTGHMDVVDPGDLTAWATDPFKATVKDGKLYGRGACDMKSGLAAVVVALLELLEQGANLPGTIKLLATVGEETGNYGAAQLTKKGYANDLDALIVCEPNNDLHDVTYACKGVVDYYVTAVGRAAHSSRPENGINAIDHLFEFAKLAKAKLDQFDQTDPALGKLTHIVSKFNGGEQINSVPSRAVLAGNIRTIPQYPNKVVYDAIDSTVAELNQQPGYHLSIRYSFPEEPMDGDADSVLIQQVQATAQQVLGWQPTPTVSTGANDGQEFTQADKEFTSLIIGPG